jgi:hypothetical protein
MKKTLYLYQEMNSGKLRLYEKEQELKHWPLIGTVELNVEQPVKEMKEVEREKPLQETDSVYFSVDGKKLMGAFWLDKDAYDVRVTYKQKVPA